jgi:drug/metabolite transporter (DMT)-like permease
LPDLRVASPTASADAAVPALSISAGIGLRLAATLLFTLMSVSVRLASVQAPVGQIVFWRSAVALVPILFYLWWRGQLRDGLKTRRPLGHLKRSALGCAAMFFSFLSLAHLPVALATALAFLAPLLVVPFAMAWLGERPGPIVIGGTLAGFAGIALMLWPALTGAALALGTVTGVAAGLANAATTALAKVEIKRLTATETPAAIAFYFAVVCSIGGLLTLPFGWAAVTGTSLMALIAAGVFGGLAHIAMTEAIARAPASTLAPFEYTAMIWAILFDILIFAIWPDAFGLGGALLIVAAAAAVAFADRIAGLFRLTPAA